MQLGELQNQIARFERRDTSILAVSVDRPTASTAMINRLGLSFALASDPDQQVVKAFGVQNPDTRELALHAVYIINREGKVFYRKVARRRPVSAELIDAIDSNAGTYPQQDQAAPRQRISVAYPQNEFQALIEIAMASQLPDIVNADKFAGVLALRQQRRGDSAIFAFKHMIEALIASHGLQQHTVLRQALYQTAGWLIRRDFYADEPELEANIEKAGLDLQRRIARVGELQQLETLHRNKPDHDQHLHTLASARAGLTRARAAINNQSGNWNLRYAKSTLRGYREVINAALSAAASRAE